MKTAFVPQVIFFYAFAWLGACAGGSTGNHEPNVEICDNGFDDDNDHLVDCLDSDCYSALACQSIYEICTNGVDDDGDQTIDCADADCASHAACIVNPTQENCENGVDDDGDQAIDCADADCASHAACIVNPTQENCENGVDDDGDQAIDCADADCASHAACTQVTNCTEDHVYTGAPAATCPAGTRCGITLQNSTYYSECRADSTFAGGMVYGACGAENACPFGSLCDASYGCMPFCDVEHTTPTYTCPGSGFCLFSITTTNNRELGLCKAIDNCDVVNNDCSGKTCVLLVEGTVCLAQTGGLPKGANCQYADDCAEGLVCVGQCLRACYLSTGAPCGFFEDCYQLVDANNNPIPVYGVCDSIF